MITNSARAEWSETGNLRRTSRLAMNDILACCDWSATAQLARSTFVQFFLQLHAFASPQIHALVNQHQQPLQGLQGFYTYTQNRHDIKRYYLIGLFSPLTRPKVDQQLDSEQPPDQKHFTHGFPIFTAGSNGITKAQIWVRQAGLGKPTRLSRQVQAVPPG